MSALLEYFNYILTVLLESIEHNESEQNKHVVWKVETSQKEVGDGTSS